VKQGSTPKDKGEEGLEETDGATVVTATVTYTEDTLEDLKRRNRDLYERDSERRLLRQKKQKEEKEEEEKEEKEMKEEKEEKEEEEEEKEQKEQQVGQQGQEAEEDPHQQKSKQAIALALAAKEEADTVIALSLDEGLQLAIDAATGERSNVEHATIEWENCDANAVDYRLLNKMTILLEAAIERAKREAHEQEFSVRRLKLLKPAKRMLKQLQEAVIVTTAAAAPAPALQAAPAPSSLPASLPAIKDNDTRQKRATKQGQQLLGLMGNVTPTPAPAPAPVPAPTINDDDARQKRATKQGHQLLGLMGNAASEDTDPDAARRKQAAEQGKRVVGLLSSVPDDDVNCTAKEGAEAKARKEAKENAEAPHKWQLPLHSPKENAEARRKWQLPWPSPKENAADRRKWQLVTDGTVGLGFQGP
jgi:hypothetical protein